MNIIDAIKSGKPFKRPSMEYWCIYRDGTLSTLNGQLLDTSAANTLDSMLLCYDWAIQDERIELSWQQISDAYIQNLDKRSLHVASVKKQLGFKEEQA